MMTIKVCKRNDLGFFDKTYLHEVNNPRYVDVEFKDYEDFCRIYKEYSSDYKKKSFMDMNVIKESENNGGHILVISFDIDETIGRDGVIFTRNSTVYIMSDGKTVDTIYCGI